MTKVKNKGGKWQSRVVPRTTVEIQPTEKLLGERDWAFGYCSNLPLSPGERLMFSIDMKKDRDERVKAMNL